MAGQAKRLGWSGICWISREADPERMEELNQQRFPIDVASGVALLPRKRSELEAGLQRWRQQAEVVLVQGGDLELNRAVADSQLADLLANPWAGRQDCGVNHVIAGAARENNVAVAFPFTPLLHVSGRHRAELLSSYLQAAVWVRNRRAPFALVSAAESPWDLRSPSDLISFGRVLGFQDHEIKSALSGSRIAENRKRLAGKWIMPGVDVE